VRIRRSCAARLTRPGLRDWQYLATGRTFRVPELDAPVHGLSLPASVLRKIYSANAERWFGNPWHAPPLHPQELK